MADRRRRILVIALGFCLGIGSGIVAHQRTVAADAPAPMPGRPV